MANDARGVLVEVEGDPGGRGRSWDGVLFRSMPPPMALVESVLTGIRAAPQSAEPASRSPLSGTGAGARAVAPSPARTWPPARLPGRARRPGRPPVPPSVHHLHELRTAIHHHHRTALRPAGDDDGRVPDVRGLRRRVRRPGRPPLPRPAHLLPRLRPAARLGRARADASPRRGRAREARAAPRRAAGSSRSRASAAITWRATPGTTGAVTSCASASSAATSRSR